MKQDFVIPSITISKARFAKVVKRGSSSHPYIYIRGTTTTTTTPTPDAFQKAFCESCSDWISDEGWQEDGSYFCPTCLEFREVDLVWKPDECLINDISENFS